MKKIFISKSRREKIALIGKLGTAILLTGIMFLIVGGAGQRQAQECFILRELPRELLQHLGKRWRVLFIGT